MTNRKSTKRALLGSVMAMVLCLAMLVGATFAWFTDTALEKLVYLAYRDISGKWTMPLSNWALISQQLAIKFGDRFKIM